LHQPDSGGLGSPIRVKRGIRVGFYFPSEEGGAETERRVEEFTDLRASMNDQALRPLADQMSVCAALVDLLIDKGLVSEQEFFERFQRARAAGRRSAAPHWLDGQAVLLVEGHADFAHKLQAALEEAGAEVLVARNAGEALARLAEFEFTAAVLDWRPETREHRTATRWLKEDGIPVLFLAVDPSEEDIAECGGPMLARPSSAEEIASALARLVGSDGA
jgi:CheY-like chemotaxis protein